MKSKWQQFLAGEISMPAWEKKAQREYYHKNKEKILQQKHKWRDENREEILKRQRIRNQSPSVKAYKKKWKEDYLAKNGITYTAMLYNKNKDKINERKREWTKIPANRKQYNNYKKVNRQRKIAIRKYCFGSVAILCVDAIESNGKRIPITQEGLEFLRSVVGFNPYKWRPSYEERKAYDKKRNKMYLEKYGLKYHAKRYRDKQKRLDPNYKWYAWRKTRTNFNKLTEVPALKRKTRVSRN